MGIAQEGVVDGADAGGLAGRVGWFFPFLFLAAISGGADAPLLAQTAVLPASQSRQPGAARSRCARSID